MILQHAHAPADLRQLSVCRVSPSYTPAFTLSCTPVNNATGLNTLHCRLHLHASFSCCVAHRANLHHLSGFKNPSSASGLSCGGIAEGSPLHRPSSSAPGLWLFPGNLHPVLTGCFAHPAPVSRCCCSGSFRWLNFCCNKVQIKGLQADQ